MARPIVLSNGELHVGLNKWGLVHDFYFPYVGLENHSAGRSLRHRVGVWCDQEMHWLDSGEWEFSHRYPHSALIGHTLAKNPRIGIVLEFDDFIDAHTNAFLRNIHIINVREDEREVRLFMHQAFAIGDSRSNTDTVQYLPGNDAVLHYRGRRAFVVSGSYDDQPFDQHTVGLFGIEGREGTFRDADDGELAGGNVEHGRVDSTIRFSMRIGAHSSVRAHYWIAAGTSLREALYVHKRIQDKGVLPLLHETADWWHKWLTPVFDLVPRIAKDHREMFMRSVMILKSQIDKRGAIMASTDTTMLNYSRDAYAYCWPRDGALVMWPLIRMGYTDEPRRFFEFCKRGMQPDGYMLHKYRSDGALGSSWHPYVHNGEQYGPPIQEDETALVLFMFAQFYHKTQDERLLDAFYESMIVPMAEFMCEYIDESTGLPKPSYDLWEERHLTTTYTTATVHAALFAASELAQLRQDETHAVKWQSAADDIATAAQKHLINHERKAFYKGIVHDGDERRPDGVIDTSSVFGAFMFGLFPADSPEITQAIATTKAVFNVTLETPALPRYENDNYQRAGDDKPSNWWFITSLWLAQYELEAGNEALAMRILDWTKDHMLSTGVLSEQINPLDDSLVSVAPLTWSHAEYLSTLLDTITEHPSTH